jgi:NDP-sugar pyrophosphorylase family protein
MLTMIDTAIILAGGKGERLRPLTNDRPKVMVELDEKPILLWQIEWLKSHGIKKFILTVSYKHEVIEKFLGDGSKFGIEVDYSVEENPLGRGGAIKQGFKSRLIDGAEDVVITNGDIITRFNLSKMIENHQSKDAQVSILLVPYLSRWGVVKVDDEDHVTGFEEKPKLPYWINGGIYIFSKDLEPLLPVVGDHETETFPKISKEKFLAFKDEGFWRAVDVVKDRSEAEEFLSNGKEDFK